MLETLIGGLFGGVARLAPVVTDLISKKMDHEHELKMLDKNIEFEKLKAAQQIEQTKLDGELKFDEKGLDALIEAQKAQATPTGVKWVDALNASVRPVLTYWWALVLYSSVLVATAIINYAGGMDATHAILSVWGASERGIVSSIFSFWFLDRVFRKQAGV